MQGEPRRAWCSCDYRSVCVLGTGPHCSLGVHAVIITTAPMNARLRSCCFRRVIWWCSGLSVALSWRLVDMVMHAILGETLEEPSVRPAVYVQLSEDGEQGSGGHSESESDEEPGERPSKELHLTPADPAAGMVGLWWGCGSRPPSLSRCTWGLPIRQHTCMYGG